MSPEPLILIVDDDEEMRLSLEALVQSIGWRAAVFDSGLALFSFPGLLLEARCVISDLRMPGMSGLELVRKLAQQAPGLPVILITAYLTDAVTNQAAAAGALCILKKPVASGEIITRLREALGP